jgi:hypothetical protein
MRTWLKAAAAATFVLGLTGLAQAIPPCGMPCESWPCPGDARTTWCSYSEEACHVHYTCSDLTTHNELCSCGGGCFLAGTKITMADRSEKPIEEIKAGDMVLAYDEKTGELKPDRVKMVHDPVVADGYLIVNEKLFLTKVHPVLTPSGWKEIGTLKVGDSLIGADKREIAIASIKLVPEQVKVYNFATNPYQTYVANGVIVHNKTPIPTE